MNKKIGKLFYRWDDSAQCLEYRGSDGFDDVSMLADGTPSHKMIKTDYDGEIEIHLVNERRTDNETFTLEYSGDDGGGTRSEEYKAIEGEYPRVIAAKLGGWAKLKVKRVIGFPNPPNMKDTADVLAKQCAYVHIHPDRGCPHQPTNRDDHSEVIIEC